MMKELLLGSVLLFGAAICARADDTGLASIHDWRREGGKVCMSEHFHDGSGNGNSRKAAEESAIRAWASFTDFEYGSIWASYTLSASKRMDCKQNGGQDWSCSVSARPCRGSAIAGMRKSTKQRSVAAAVKARRGS
jgi:hypothetical protein